LAQLRGVQLKGVALMVKVSMGQKVATGALVVILGWWGWLAISEGGSVEVQLWELGISIKAGDEGR
jgi:hypothetical protein